VSRRPKPNIITVLLAITIIIIAVEWGSK